MNTLLCRICLIFLLHNQCADAVHEATRLFEDLLSGYNKLIRPNSGTNSTILKVLFKMRLSQLLDVHEKNQIMTTNVWLEHEWYDNKLSWSPSDYGNVTVLYVPGELIWLPDIVLYNNADGNYQVTIMTKAVIKSDGKVSWNPPAIYKSMCHIDVEWFPFDEQTCHMKFGSWTYDGFQVDLLHKTDQDIKTFQIAETRIDCVENGIDLSDYYKSTEWDVLAVPGWKKRAFYPCCPTPYIDITYKIFLRRKTLFYSVNLILPCVGISFLTVLVFYLPSDSGEKVTLSISILISLTVFFLLLVEIIPSTSIVIPLIGKYLLFTMIMVTLSIAITVVVINFHFRSPTTHVMSRFVRRWFMERLPPLLLLGRPHAIPTDMSPSAAGLRRRAFGLQRGATALKQRRRSVSVGRNGAGDAMRLTHDDLERTQERLKHELSADEHVAPCNCEGARLRQRDRLVAQTAMQSVQSIVSHLRQEDAEEQVMEEWRFVAMVIDRVFLVLFCATCVVGSSYIILRAPSLYDSRVAIDSGNQLHAYQLNGVQYCSQ